MNVEDNLRIISKNDKFLFLAYDQGFEIGPTEFNEKNVDPEYIFKIADNGYFTAVIVHKGLAEKYYVDQNRKSPLIVKLNGRDKIYDGEPISYQLCSVGEAFKLGAVAVGYTIYVGSDLEPEMLKEFGRIQEEAHALGLPVIAWMYPRGKYVKDPLDNDVTAYAARVGLEMGADLLKVHYTHQPDKFHWVISSAGRAKVLSSGGAHQNDEYLLREAREVMLAGAAGMAVGRGVWESENPDDISRKIYEIVIEGKINSLGSSKGTGESSIKDLE
jgi:fructose-bisphosphate aldolase, class I